MDTARTMKTIEVKFGIGDKVTHFTGVYGMVTAIFHRGGRNEYEMAYLNSDGDPEKILAAECELEVSNNGSIGFEKKRHGS